MGLGGTGGKAPDLELADKLQFQICPFSSLSLIHLTCKMQVAVTNVLTVPSPLGDPQHLFLVGSPMRTQEGATGTPLGWGRFISKGTTIIKRKGPHANGGMWGTNQGMDCLGMGSTPHCVTLG